MGLTHKRWRSHAAIEIALFFQLISFGEVTSLLASNYTNLVTSSVPLSCHEICDYDKLFGIADCEGKGLYRVPHSYGCEGTTVLKVNENHIQHIDNGSLNGYTDLKTLDASRNQVSVIDSESFINLKLLRNILFQHNQLSYILNGTFVGTGQNLKRLILNNNELHFVHENAFYGLDKVNSLYLSFNQIETLPLRVFQSLRELQSLYLNDNRLCQIGEDIFRGLTSLQKLYLNNNKLKWLPRRLFSGLRSLREVLLFNNNLINVPEPIGYIPYDLLDVADNKLNQSGSILPYLEKTKRVYLEGNPFVCDCNFQQIQVWYQNKSVTEQRHYESRRPVVCDGRFSVTDSIPIVCNITETEQIPSKEAWTSAPVVWTTETLDLSTTIIFTPPKNQSDGEHLSKKVCSDPIFYEKQKQLIVLLYSAVILTLFFIAWILKTVAEILPSQRTKEEKIV